MKPEVNQRSAIENWFKQTNDPTSQSSSSSSSVIKRNLAPQLIDENGDQVDLIKNKSPKKESKKNNETSDHIDSLATLGFYEKLLKILVRFVRQVKWSNVVLMGTFHVLFIVGYLHVTTKQIKLITAIFSFIIGNCSGFGTSVGAHRLWAHRSFKARWPLKIWLLLFQTIQMNGSVYSYARDHRTHHKYSDTEGDPKNPSKGLFHSHIGWWLWRKPQSVIDAGSKLSFDDLRQDRLVWFQHQHYKALFLIFGVILPVAIPYFVWNESFLSAFYTCVIIRITISLHHVFTVNSLAHYLGHRPYDFRIFPTDNRLVNYLSVGEGQHNYHHVFAYDYRANEKEFWEFFNPITLFIEICIALGLAYDARKASPETIQQTIERTGPKQAGKQVLFDQKLPFKKRLINGLIDWSGGISVMLWPLIPIVFYKLITNQPMPLI